MRLVKAMLRVVEIAWSEENLELLRRLAEILDELMLREELRLEHNRQLLKAQLDQS